MTQTTTEAPSIETSTAKDKLKAGLSRHAGSILVFAGIIVHSVEVWSASQLTIESQHIMQQTTLAEMMGDYYKTLQDHNPVHNDLGSGGEWYGVGKGPPDREAWNITRRYVGLLEQIDVWHMTGIVSPEVMDSTYSHRIARVFNSDAVREKFLVEEAEHWTMFSRLVNTLWDMPSFSGRRTAGLTRPSLPPE